MESYGLKRAGWDKLRSRIGGFEGCRTVVGVGCRIGPLREKDGEGNGKNGAMAKRVEL